MYHTLFLTTVLFYLLALQTCATQPNIIFIISDDQDLRLNSPNYMPNLQESIISQGVNFHNHYGTVALCCPARATLFRGQAAHNTNITHVGGPGGGYQKFVHTGEMADYLPLWLQKAGYSTAYIGKFMNGYNSRAPTPPGWDELDLLTAPWIYNFNHVVMRKNGEHAVLYEGWHQTDVLRLKALDLIEKFTTPPLADGQVKPFYLEIAPASPHVRPGGWPTVPLARHKFHFPGVVAPRLPNWNPGDEEHQGKPAWMGELAQMNDSVIEISDASYRARLQGLQGVDEIVADVVAMLEKKGILDETFIIYTTDNGFHLGQHRVPGGKGLPYVEDVNLPFAVRGPGISAGRMSAIPQTHVDVAPTLLDIAGLPRDDWPPFFDGRSLLPEWQSADDEIALSTNTAVSREVINVEYWGLATLPAGKWTTRQHDHGYKSLRIISHDGSQGWLFNKWCTANQTELYDISADPYELHNLAISPDKDTKRLIDRLSGLLLVTKSCGQDSCRRPWEVLHTAYRNASPMPEERPNPVFTSLEQAMESKFDAFFASLPTFGFHSCLPFQSPANEGPFLPPEAEDLGRRYRDVTHDLMLYTTNGTLPVEADEQDYFGDVSQRYSSIEDLQRNARMLTDEEMGWLVPMSDDEWWAEMDDD